jgi:hypothetical protein
MVGHEVERVRDCPERPRTHRVRPAARGAVVLVMAGLIAWGAGCAGDGPPTRERREQSAPAAEARREQSAPAAESRPTAVMPAIPCGTNLQTAQNRVQEAGVFLSRSRDATGQGRSQIRDRNWTVVDQSPAPGTPIGEGDAVFFVVKNEEFTGC